MSGKTIGRIFIKDLQFIKLTCSAVLFTASSEMVTCRDREAMYCADWITLGKLFTACMSTAKPTVITFLRILCRTRIGVHSNNCFCFFFHIAVHERRQLP